MNVNGAIAGAVLPFVLVLILFGCAGTPESATDTEVVAEPTESASVPEEPTPEPEAVEEVPVDVEEEFSQEDVTEELYDQTFTEVEATIAELNEIITNQDFARWQYYLTDNYRLTYSNPRVLEESSQSAILRRNNITLRTLEDYFRFVVVPSRANVRLDEIVFVDESTVEAIMEVQGEKYLLYNLTKAGDRWKIDTF